MIAIKAHATRRTAVGPAMTLGLALAALAALAARAVPAVAQATGAPRLAVTVDQRTGGGGVAPVSYFKIPARPGATVVAGRITVHNAGSEVVRADIDPVDAVTARNLGTAYHVRGLQIGGPTRWARLSARTVRIRPHGSVGIDVALRVPAGARPGDYLTGISIEARGQHQIAQAGARVAVSSSQRFVVGLQADVPGPRQPLVRITDMKVEQLPAGVTFLFKARNAGNAILQGVRGTLDVTMQDGRRVMHEAIGPGTFLSGTSIEYQALARTERPPAGTRYRVRLTLQYPGGVARREQVTTFGSQQAARAKEFTRIPPAATERRGRVPGWVLPAGAASVLLAIALALAIARRRRRRLLSRDAAARLIDAELRGIDTHGRPVSVILVAAGTDGTDRCAAAIRSRLRHADALCDLGPDGLLVVAPDTGSQAAAGLTEDLTRTLANGAPAPRVASATATRPTTAQQLVDEARRRATA